MGFAALWEPTIFSKQWTPPCAARHQLQLCTGQRTEVFPALLHWPANRSCRRAPFDSSTASKQQHILQRGQSCALPCQLAATTASEQTCNSCLPQPSLLCKSCRRLAIFETLPFFHIRLKLAHGFTALFDSRRWAERAAPQSLSLEDQARRAEVLLPACRCPPSRSWSSCTHPMAA